MVKARSQSQTVALVAPRPILDRHGPFLLDPLQSEVQDVQNRFIVWKGGFGAPGDAVCDWKGGSGAPGDAVCDWKGGSGAPGDAVCDWKDAADLEQLMQAEVERFDGIGGIQRFADRRRTIEEYGLEPCCRTPRAGATIGCVTRRDWLLGRLAWAERKAVRGRSATGKRQGRCKRSDYLSSQAALEHVSRVVWPPEARKLRSRGVEGRFGGDRTRTRIGDIPEKPALVCRIGRLCGERRMTIAWQHPPPIETRHEA